MNAERRAKINQLADGVRQYLGLDIPVDVSEAVRKLDGEIRETVMMPGEDAYVQKLPEGAGKSFVIVIDKSQSLARRSFSIAHELGHLFLHMGYLINDERWRSYEVGTGGIHYRTLSDRSQKEYDANEFAAAFLMPKTDFVKAVREVERGGIITTEEIAKRFNVSVDAAANRGKWLGLFKW
jgi:Zn-dependent peptidase ImmA (M78 family)